MEDLQHLPALNEDLVETITKASQSKSTTSNSNTSTGETGNTTLTAEQKAIDSWLYDGMFLDDVLPTSNLPTHSPRNHPLQLGLHQECMEKAMKEHFSTMDLLLNQHRWDAVFLPAGAPISFTEESDPSKSIPDTNNPSNNTGGLGGIGIPSLAAMQKKYPPKSLKNLTSDIMCGKEMC